MPRVFRQFGATLGQAEGASQKKKSVQIVSTVPPCIHAINNCYVSNQRNATAHGGVLEAKKTAGMEATEATFRHARKSSGPGLVANFGCAKLAKCTVASL